MFFYTNDKTVADTVTSVFNGEHPELFGINPNSDRYLAIRESKPNYYHVHQAEILIKNAIRFREVFKAIRVAVMRDGSSTINMSDATMNFCKKLSWFDDWCRERGIDPRLARNNSKTSIYCEVTLKNDNGDAVSRVTFKLDSNDYYVMFYHAL